jgi:virulence-associated protein VagC
MKVDILLIYTDSGEGFMPVAKVFWSGRSQAIRLPKEYRFDTDEVRVPGMVSRRSISPAESRTRADWLPNALTTYRYSETELRTMTAAGGSLRKRERSVRRYRRLPVSRR